jgi:hypothetical protein
MEFAKLTDEQTNWLLNNQFKHRGIVNSDEIWEIKRVFNLKDLDENEATALRNTVVCLVSNVENAYIEMGDVESFHRIQDTMSAVTCVIDLRINSFRR